MPSWDGVGPWPLWAAQPQLALSRSLRGQWCTLRGPRAGPGRARGLDHDQFREVLGRYIADQPPGRVDDTHERCTRALQPLEDVVEAGVLGHGRYVAGHDVENRRCAARL